MSIISNGGSDWFTREGVIIGLISGFVGALSVLARRLDWRQRAKTADKKVDAETGVQFTTQFLQREAVVWQDLRRDMEKLQTRLDAAEATAAQRLEEIHELRAQVRRIPALEARQAAMQQRIRELENQIREMGGHPADNSTDDDMPAF